MRNLAVIPARAGSTRLKNKNIYPINGKPLIRWITETVVLSRCFDDVLISTDGDEIFNAVSDLPVVRHNRPDVLATTTATVLDAMLDVMCGVKNTYDTFSYFLPTCPFVSVDDIKSGIDKINDADSVVSVTEFSETVQLACLMSSDGRVFPVFDNLEKGITNSKFLKKFYRPSGAFYISNWDKIKINRNFFVGNVCGVLVPKERSVDINDSQDVLYAEAILAKNKRI